MKLAFIHIESQKESWANDAQDTYETKIKRFCEFEIIKIKSPSHGRDQKDLKVLEESKLVLSKIKDQDFLVLFDEKGKDLDSVAFAKALERTFESNPKRVVFLIGGAFGVSDEIKSRVQLTLSLSKMVMNHHVAMTVALEQIYRAFTIQKGIPYHNI